MNIQSKRDEGILVLSLEGRLDAQGTRELEKFLKDHVPETDRTLVFDMSRVLYLSSTGIRIIVATVKKMNGRKGCLLLANVQQYALSVLEMTGVLTLLSLHPTCDDAVRAARSVVATEEMKGRSVPISFTIRGAEYGVTRIGKDENILEISGYPSDGMRQNRDDEIAVPCTVSTKTCSMGWGHLASRLNNPQT